MIATTRAVDLALRHQHRFHVLHVSTAAELPIIKAAAPYVTAEVCLHHLFFNVDDYARLGTRIQMNPSIKTAADNQALLARTVGRHDPSHRHRPRAAHAGRKSSTLSQPARLACRPSRTVWH